MSPAWKHWGIVHVCNSSAVGSRGRRPAGLAGFWPSSRHSEIVGSNREEASGLLCPLKVHRQGCTCTRTEDGESGVRESPVDKGGSCQTCWPEFGPWNAHGRTDPTSSSVLWPPFLMCAP